LCKNFIPHVFFAFHYPQGNVLATYEALGPGTPQLLEQPIYGSARLGERKPTMSPGAVPTLGLNGQTYSRTLSQRVYELSDHLGNVRVVVGDRKDAVLTSTSDGLVASQLTPQVQAYFNYYAFGQLQPGRYIHCRANR
jgi:hypothetical protein